VFWERKTDTIGVSRKEGRPVKDLVVWLDEVEGNAPALLGGKGDRLAAMTRSRFPVPRGFCLTVRAYEAFTAENALGTVADPGRLRAALMAGRFPASLERAILDARRRLDAETVAVRSSSTAEDLPAASSAGQQETFLNVRGESELLDSIRRCWASMWTERAVAYRAESTLPPGKPGIAVVVQAMIPCDVAGVAFSVDPLTGAQAVVLECAAGLGEQVVSGMPGVKNYRLERPGLDPSRLPPGALLTPEQARQLAATTLALEEAFGAPQDVEWGFQEGKLYLFQSRPITVLRAGFFTETIAGDDFLWTSGFLNERFPSPVSPLGWTLIRELLEPLAFRDPLRFMGYRWPAGVPITKLYCGHPFVNVRVFQVLYKPFPEFLLPEDARRYFPGGNTRMRRQADYPCCKFDARLVGSMLWHVGRDPANCSPCHNFRRWAGFVRQHDQATGVLRARVAALNENSGLDEAMSLLQETQALSARLLAIHRWTLTHADLFYSLLRRLLAAWLGNVRGADLAAKLVAGLPNKSTELNRALQQLATDAGWQAFVNAYGHRSFCLDIYEPTFGERPDEVRRVAGQGRPPETEKLAAQRESLASEVRRALKMQRWGWLKSGVFDVVHSYTCRYMPLREDQRFQWQKGLALQRQIVLWIGRRLLRQGALENAQDVFFATLPELRLIAAGRPLPAQEISQRRSEFAQLQHDCELAPDVSYPCFLRGNQPLLEESVGEEGVLRGQPVSPGIARGLVRVLTTPEQLARIAPGEILVTRGADPGWTVVFGRIAGLVMEVGGQLSHGAVVAREYGLPAVVGIHGATRRLKDGQEVIVDGLAGTVILLRDKVGNAQRPPHK
jgi:pyruvate,water dikinase